MKIAKTFFFSIIVLVALFAGLFFGTAFDMFLSKEVTSLKIYPLNFCIDRIINSRQALILSGAFAGLFIVGILVVAFNSGGANYNADMYEVTPEIKIPKPYGQYQHGSAWWMSKKAFNKAYAKNTINLKSATIKYLIETGYDDLPLQLQKRKSSKTLKNLFVSSLLSLKLKSKRLNRINYQPFKKGGLVVAYEKSKDKEKFYYILNDTHTLVIGSTGCGKSRCLVIQSICNLALAGESIFVTDPKGELYQYSKVFLEKLGYNVLVIDFKNMEKSMSYNLLQPIINSFKNNNMNKAIQECRDIANILVGEKSSNGEPLWHNGELAVVSASIIACVYDNMDKPQNQNLPYVYEFITRMCAERKGKPLLLQEYLEVVGESHPANLLLAQANVAPSKTRGSFYTSAATTLSLWIDRELYHIVKKSDFKMTDLTTKKTAMFIILPDNKTTFHGAATVIVSQLYDQLIEYADTTAKTGRLPRRVNFLLDEFGNFAPINGFDSKLSAGRSRGIRFNLFLQDLSQLDKKYDKEVAKTIKGNCQTWIYLLANEKETEEEVVHRLGNYTTSTYSLSSSKNSSGGTSMNLIERKLLTTEEIGRLKRPHQLVMGNGGSKVVYAPDLSYWSFNQMLGLGNEEHNEKVRGYREENRTIYNDVSMPPDYNGIWLDFEDFSLQHQYKNNKEMEGIYIEG